MSLVIPKIRENAILQKKQRVKMAVCYRCGETDREKDTWRFCSITKRFICKQCAECCEHYSKNLLPNGQHCKLKYFPIGSYLVSPETIQQNRAQYDGLSTLELTSRIDEMRRRYLKSEDKEVRRSYQIRLASAQTVLEERKKREN